MLKGPQSISELFVESVLRCKENLREGQQNDEGARKSVCEVNLKRFVHFSESETD